MSRRIIRVAASEFKGRSFCFDLEPVTVFCGPNAAGKSAVLEAVSLAALGYVPGEDKPTKAARDIYELFGRRGTMEVGIMLSDSSSMTRKWQVQGGVVKASSSGASDIPSTLFDTSAFTGLTGPARMRYLLRLAKGADVNPTAIRDRLAAAIRGARVEGADEACERALGAIAGDLDSPGEDEAACDYLDRVVDELKCRKSEVQASVKRLRSTMQGLVQAAQERKPARPDAEDAARATAAARDAAFADVGRCELAVEQCRAKWKDLAALRDRFRGCARDRELLEELRSRPLASEPEPPDPGAARKDLADADLALADVRGTIYRLTTDLSGLEVGEKALAESKCPTCGQHVDNAAKLKAVREKISDAKARLESSHEQATALGDLVAKKKQDVDSAQARHREWSALQLEIAKVSGRLNGAPTDADLVEERFSAVTQEGAVLADELREARCRLDGANAARAAADEQLKLLLRQRSEEAQAAAVEKALGEEESRKLAYDVAADASSAMAEQFVSSTIGGLLARCNALCEEFLPTPVRHQDGEFLLASGRGFRSMSDSEKVVFAAALSCTLAAACSDWRIACVGRMECLDEDRRAALLDKLVRMVGDGSLDQAILVGVGKAGAYRRDGVKVIEVGDHEMKGIAC